MKKFNYIKWKSGVLPGLLTEQTGSYITCYGCTAGQIVPNNNTFTGSYDISYNNITGYCGHTNPTSNSVQYWYDSSNNSALSDCGNATVTQTPTPTCYVCLSGSQESGPANTSMGSYNTGSGYCHISSSSWQIANAPGNLNPASPPWSTSNIPSYNACTGSAGTGSGCDTSPNSPCAQTWFGNKAPNFANFMLKLSCDNNPTYLQLFDRLVNQQIWGGANLWANRPNQNVQWPAPGNAPTNWNQIKQLAKDAFGTGPAGAAAGRGKFKRQLAKLMYVNCMNSNQVDGCCST